MTEARRVALRVREIERQLVALQGQLSLLEPWDDVLERLRVGSRDPERRAERAKAMVAIWEQMDKMDKADGL